MLIYFKLKERKELKERKKYIKEIKEMRQMKKLKSVINRCSFFLDLFCLRELFNG